MHFEIFVEDFSGKELLNILVPKIISTSKNTFRIFPYRGIGKIPKNLQGIPDPKKKLLLDKLPAILKAYGKGSKLGDLTIIIVVDCDTRDCKVFKQELINVLESCNQKPAAFFRIAIEETEAWLLGDKKALEKAYPKMKKAEYSKYKQDSIVGTWEKLADITLTSEAAKNLKRASYHEIGKQKIEWVQRIGTYMDIDYNSSPSFNCFKSKLEELAK